MPKMTVSVPDELLKQLKLAFPETNWAEVARSSIVKKLEKVEKLQQRGEL